jgi:hypothetical protein
MVQVIKSEWHSVEKRYITDIDENTLMEIYPDLKKKEIKSLMKELESGDAPIEQVIEDAGWDVDLEWDWMDEDDWWTDRKGGYDITYELAKHD